MHIIAHGLEITVATAVHVHGFVAPTEEVPKLFVPMVETTGIYAQEPFHPLDQVAARGFRHQMEVVAQEAKGVNLPVRLGAGFSESFHKERAVLVIGKDGLAAVAAIHRVINRPGVLEAQLPSHPGGDLDHCARLVKAGRRLN